MQTHLLRRACTSVRLTSLLPGVVVLFAALAMLAWAQQASAHASLISSSPAMGSILQQAPTEIRLSFNEPVSPLVLKLVQPDGTTRDMPQHSVSGNALQLVLPSLVQQGTYALSWRVVSTDGHPVGGSLLFSIGVQAGGPADELTTTRPVLAGWLWLVRLIGYAGLFFGIGMAVCQSRTSAGSEPRRLGGALLALGAIATVASAGLFGVDALGMPLAGLLNLDTWRIAASTSHGLSALFALLALACAAVVWRVNVVAHRCFAAGAAIVLCAGAFAASGHASAAPPVWLARPAVWLHTVAVTLWIGAFPALLYALGRSLRLDLIDTFSRLIPLVLGVLFVSGALLIFLQFDAVPSLWQTEYGRVLMAKLGLVFLLLALGAYNRYHLTRAVLAGERAARDVMRRVILIECVLAIAILGVVALWRFTPPPRALSDMAAAAPAISAHIHTATAMAELTWMPGTVDRPGSLNLHLSKPDLSPLAVQEVTVAFANPAAGIEPVVLPAQTQGDGSWHVPAIELPHQSSWVIRIEALISDFERLRLESTLSVPQ